MSGKSWRVSSSGQLLIQQAKIKKGWKTSEDDPRPLKEASKFLLIQYAKTNNFEISDRMRWMRDFDLLFGRKKTANKKAIDRIKLELIKSSKNSCLKILDKLIEEEEIYPAGISYGTWKRFASQSKREAILESAFKAYCHILELDWQAIIEPEAEIEQAIAQATKKDLKVNSFVPLLACQNLPTPEQSQFIGREEELKVLLKYLGNDRIHRISIQGIGGAGKTSFALEAAYRCLKANVGNFEAIIFTSAKPQRLKTRQILSRLQRERTLDDILGAIAKTLNDPDLLVPDKQTRLERVIDSLKPIKTLLIIDNLETYDDIESILAFIYELPSTVKVIITSREQALLEDFKTISLSSLTQEEAIALINSHLQDKELQLSIQQSQLLYQKTGGIPAAIVYALGQLKAGYALESILPQMTLATADFARFYFAGSLNALREKPAYKLLMALVVFPQGATRDAIATVAGITDSIDVEMGFARLKQLSLIQCQQQQFSLLPLTRSYALAELQVNFQLESDIRSRWVNYYKSYLEKSGEQNLEDGSDRIRLELEWKNLREVMEWCIEQECHSDFYQLWRYIKDYTRFHGYWQERFVWMDWLIEASQKRQDWQTTAESMLDKGKTLLLLGQPQQHQDAIALLERAWMLSQDYSSNLHLCEVAIDLAISYMQQHSFQEAHLWLDRVENLLGKNFLESSNNERLQVKLFYYRAETFLLQTYYERAKEFYLRSLDLAKSFNWERGIIYNELSLAVIAIEEKQNLVWARKVLKENTKLIYKNKDKRCLAFCKRAFALLEKANENLSKASEWATAAKQDFSRLAMKQQATEMQLWIEKWNEI